MNTKIKYILSVILGIAIAIPSISFALSIFAPQQGGTGIGSALVGDIGKCLTVSNNSPFSYAFATCASGGGGGSGGGAWATNTPNTLTYITPQWTALFGGTSTTTNGNRIEVQGGVYINGNSTTTKGATTTGLAITGLATPAGAYLAVNPQGSVIATTTPTTGSSASSTLLADNNTFSNALSTFAGTAAKATILATSRLINGVSFNGSGDITINAASSTELTDSNTFSGLLNTITNLFVTRSTTTQATSTYSFATTASSTNLFTQLFFGAGLGACNGASQGLTWLNGVFGCNTYTLTGGSGNVSTSSTETAGQLAYWTTTGGTPAKLSTVATNTVTCTGQTTCTSFVAISGSPIVINTPAGGGSATSTLYGDNGTWTGSNQFVGPSTTVMNLTSVFSTSTQATTTNLFASLLTATQSFFGNLFVTGSSTFQDVTMRNATTSSATTTSLYVSGRTGLGATAPITTLDVRSVNANTGSTVGGNVNIASTDAENIDIGGSLTFGGYNDSGASVFRVFGSVEGRKSTNVSGSSNGYLVFKTDLAGGLTERMRILDSGNIGIGTTSPYSMLSVAGQVVAQNYIATSTTAVTSLQQTTMTNATATNLFATLASTTNFFGAGLSSCAGASNGLTWTNGTFGCNTITSGSAASSTLLADNNTFTGSNTVQFLTSIRSTTTNATTTGVQNVGSLVIGTLNGLLKGVSGAVTTATAGTDYENPLTFSNGVSRSVNAVSLATINAGVLGAVANGSIPTSQATSSLYLGTAGQVLAQTANGWVGVATTTFSGLLSYSAGNVTCPTCVASTRSILTTYPVTGGGDLSADRTIALAFGTTTNNNWSGLNVFQGASTTFVGNVTITGNATATNATTTNFTVTNAPIFSALTGLLKGNGSSPLTTAVNGTDFSLITANTCGAGQHFNQVTAAGVFTCTADTGSGGSFPFTTVTNWATTTSATTTMLFVQQGIQASSTSYFTNLWITGSSTINTATIRQSTTTNATSTNFAATTICLTGDTCRTSWPASSGKQLPTFIVAASGGDFTTIQGAVTQCGVVGGANIYLTDAVYAQGGTGITWRGSNCNIYGRDATTTITFTGATTLFKTNSAAGQYSNVGLHHLVITGDGNASGVAIDASDMTHATYEDIVLDNIGTAIKLNDTQNITFYNKFEKISATTIVRFGINASSTNPVNGNIFTDLFMGCSANCTGLEMNNGNNNLFIGFRPEPGTTVGTVGIHLFDSTLATNNGVFDNIFMNTYAEANGTGIKIEATRNVAGGGIQRNKIIGGIFDANTTDFNIADYSKNSFEGVDNNFSVLTSFQSGFAIAKGMAQAVFDVLDNGFSQAAMLVTNNTNFAHNSLDFIKFSLLNASDSSNLLNLSNLGTGATIIATSTRGTDLILTGGKLGIGTSSPWAKLSVTGVSGSTDPIFNVASSSQFSIFQVRADGSVVNNFLSGTTSKQRAMSGPDSIAVLTAASTNSMTNDDLSRMIQCSSVANSGVISIRNGSFSTAASNVYVGTVAQQITAAVMINAVVTIRGCSTYGGYHYVLVGSSTDAASTVIRRATSSDFVSMAVAAAWSTSTVSGTVITGGLSATFPILIGAANGKLYVATSTTAIGEYQIATTTNTLTYLKTIKITGGGIAITNTRVNDNALYVGFGAAPIVRKYDFTGTAVNGANSIAATPGNGPDLVTTSDSIYALSGGSTVLLSRIQGY